MLERMSGGKRDKNQNIWRIKIMIEFEYSPFAVSRENFELCYFHSINIILGRGGVKYAKCSPVCGKHTKPHWNLRSSAAVSVSTVAWLTKQRESSRLNAILRLRLPFSLFFQLHFCGRLRHHRRAKDVAAAAHSRFPSARRLFVKLAGDH